MSLIDEVADDDGSRCEQRLVAARDENSKLRSQIKRLQLEVEELQNIAGFVGRLSDAQVELPAWVRNPHVGTGHRAVACALLSDLHLDEVVQPKEVHYLNAYDRDIATMRLQRWADKVVDLTHSFLSGVSFEGLKLLFAGDLFSGNIHEELSETNEDTLYGSLLYWLEQLIAAITYVIDAFGAVDVEAVVGNHGRMTKKPRAKLAVRDNIDWLLAHLIKRHFANDDRVTVNVSDALDTSFMVYDTKFMMTHGDQAGGGGGGIGGIWPPVKRLEARKHEREPFDTLVMGHFHQLHTDSSLILNGSMVGWNEFAMKCNFKPEPAQQALWTVSPEHGVGWQIGIECSHRPSEGW